VTWTAEPVAYCHAWPTGTSLGGVTYAVATGSITSRELNDKTIQRRDIQDGSITRAGIAASQFVPADKLVSSGSVVTIPAGAGNVSTVLSSGPFSFRPRCVKDGDAPTSYIRAYMEVASNELSEVAANAQFREADQHPSTKTTISEALGNAVAWAGGRTCWARAPSGASLDGGFSLGVIGGASLNLEPKRSCPVSIYGISWIQTPGERAHRSAVDVARNPSDLACWQAARVAACAPGSTDGESGISPDAGEGPLSSVSSWAPHIVWRSTDASDLLACRSEAPGIADVGSRASTTATVVAVGALLLAIPAPGTPRRGPGRRPERCSRQWVWSGRSRSRGLRVVIVRRCW
jgi:hypothetical protein